MLPQNRVLPYLTQKWYGNCHDVFAYSDHKRSSEVICEVSNMLTLVAQLSQFQL